VSSISSSNESILLDIIDDFEKSFGVEDSEELQLLECDTALSLSVSSLKRPPSRQKIAAQDLWDGVSSREREGIINKSGGQVEEGEFGSDYHCSDPQNEIPLRTATRQRTSTASRMHDPKSDGFLDLDDTSEQDLATFRIEVTYSNNIPQEGQQEKVSKPRSRFASFEDEEVFNLASSSADKNDYSSEAGGFMQPNSYTYNDMPKTSSLTFKPIKGSNLFHSTSAGGKRVGSNNIANSSSSPIPHSPLAHPSSPSASSSSSRKKASLNPRVQLLKQSNIIKSNSSPSNSPSRRSKSPSNDVSSKKGSSNTSASNSSSSWVNGGAAVDRSSPSADWKRFDAKVKLTNAIKNLYENHFNSFVLFLKKRFRVIGVCWSPVR
jgi:hypothetical protein